MSAQDLRAFIDQLEAKNLLKRITHPIDTHLEITEIADRVLKQNGPALLFENPTTHGQKQNMPVLANLFGTPERVALGMGQTGDWQTALRNVGT